MTDCSSLPQQEYGVFSDWLHRKVGSQRIPISGSLEVTNRCNLRCVHCYLPLEQRSGPRGKELTLNEIERILDEITEAGCLWLLLTGGDPFMRQDFLEIYAYARRKGLILTLFTNGTLITPRIADYLAEWRPFSIEITLYGATQETYERVTGISGSYSRCMHGIELLLERGLPLSLKTVLLTLNVDELDCMKALAGRLGVGFKYDPIISLAIDGSTRPTAYRLSPEQIVEIEGGDALRSGSYIKDYANRRNKKVSGKSLYICGAGRNSFHIDPFGRLSSCIANRKQFYDLRKGNFRHGWESAIPEVIGVEYTEDYACASCALRVVCLQCPAKNELEAGDPQKVMDGICRITKLRWDAFQPKN